MHFVYVIKNFNFVAEKMAPYLPTGLTAEGSQAGFKGYLPADRQGIAVS